MSEPQADYITDAMEMMGTGYDDQPAAIIDQPRKVKALRDTGLYEYRAWGWVKLSAKFVSHLRHLKGAKLAIWQCIALSIDETGTCKMTLRDIGALTDYSHTEVISSLKELEAAGYLTINRDGKTNIYQPVFVARGDNKPQETLVKKLDSTPDYQYESSPAIGNSAPSIKELKELIYTPPEIPQDENFQIIKRKLESKIVLNGNDVNTIYAWLGVHTVDRITAAIDKSFNAILKPSTSYINAVLLNWREPTKEKARTKRKPNKAQSSAPDQEYDYDALREIVKQHTANQLKQQEAML
jgi:hypothetical protein